MHLLALQPALLCDPKANQPIIGHLKVNHRMSLCNFNHLKGGNSNALLCAAVTNSRWLLRLLA
jgi:hypothetical protein